MILENDDDRIDGITEIGDHIVINVSIHMYIIRVSSKTGINKASGKLYAKGKHGRTKTMCVY